jgi:hypothetical protein
MKAFLVSIAILSGATVMATYWTNVLRNELRGLNLKSPEADAVRDIAHGQQHCYSANGAFGRYFPGVSTPKDKSYCAKIERNFRGTSDEAWSDEHYRLMLQADSYARRYNAFVLSHHD